jgi:hypothetical protein
MSDESAAHERRSERERERRSFFMIWARAGAPLNFFMSAGSLAAK